MPTPKQLVKIPVGEGLSESVDLHARNAPRADRVENATLRRSGAVAKQSGWSVSATVVGTALSGAKSLVASDQSMLVTSQNGAAIVEAAAPGTTAAQRAVGVSFHNPSHVDTIPVSSPRGQVLDVGVCYHEASDTYGIVYRELPDVTNDLDDTELGGGEVVALAVSPDSRIVAGPYRWSGGAFGVPTGRVLAIPRIECCTRSDGDAAFFVTFLVSNDATSGLIDGMSNHGIYVAGWTQDASPPSTTPTATLIGSTENNSICYDTHSVSSHDATYVVLMLFGAINVFRVDGDAATVSSRTVGTADDYERPQIFHHVDAQTVVVTEAGLGTVWCLPEDITSDTSATGLHAESNPRLYRPSTVATSSLVYSGEVLPIVGSNPGTITPTGVTSLSVPQNCWDPQPWVGNATLFIASRHGELVQPADAQDFPVVSSGVGAGLHLAEFWESTIEATLTHTDGIFRESFPILSSRLPPLVYYGVYKDPFGGTQSVGHVPQTCVDSDGRVVLGQAFGILSRKAYKRRPESQIPENASDAGFPNQDLRVALVRCSPNQVDVPRSEIDHSGSRVLAHGGLKVWDGTNIFDYIPQPKISGYIKDTAPGTRTTGITMASMASVDVAASTTSFAGSNPESFARALYPGATGGTHDTLCLMKAVLVFVDKNGTEWRSRPSPPVMVWKTALGNGLTFPRVEIELGSFAAQRVRDHGEFDVELYVTPRTKTVADGWDFETSFTSPFDLGGTYFLCQRTPLLEDADGSYVPDFYYLEQAGQSFFQATIPLFTSAGELAPYPPPATNIIARSGDYAFIVPSEFPYEFWASKPLEAGRGPEFAPELARSVPTDSGGITSLAGVGDRLFVLCRNGVYALSTLSGPDTSGLGSFGPLRLVHRGDGCVGHMLTVSTPHGVVYASENGIRMVGLDGRVQDIGRDAQEFLGDVTRFLRAVYDRREDEVLFFARDEGLRLNFRTGSYSTFTRANSVADAARPERSGRVYTMSDGFSQIFTEDSSTGLDNQQSMDMVWESTWLTFDQSSGFFRGKKIHAVLRRLSGTGDIRVTLKYNYRDTVVDTFDFAFADVFSLADPENSGHIRVHPSRQKFDAIKISVQDIQHTIENQGESQVVSSDLLWTLSGVSIEIGSKHGGIKLRAEQTSSPASS